MSELFVSSLSIYPVKGMRGVECEEVVLEPQGFRHDRMAMVIGPDRVFLSQRSHPQMARWVATCDGECFNLSHEQYGNHMVSLRGTPAEEAQVWDSTVRVQDLGDEVAEFLAQDLGRGVRLVTFEQGATRQVSQKYGGPEDIVSFADGYPVLLTTEASLEDLNQKVETPLPMNRFRPNLVVRGAEAWKEDEWLEIIVGECRFENVKPCARCSVTTTDQVTGERMGQEPLRTLATFRNQGGKVMFGINLIPRQLGVIRLGDRVSVGPYRTGLSPTA